TLPRDIMLSLDELKTRSETRLRQARLEGKLEGQRLGKLEGQRLGKLEGQRLGKLEGQRLGKLEGQRAVLRRQLLQRFGSLSPELATRLAQGEPADLERWATRILTASTAEDVLD
ncbi:MAG: hypothetical protein AAGC55_33975, partial [Myxococcota bacterium]